MTDATRPSTDDWVASPSPRRTLAGAPREHEAFAATSTGPDEVTAAPTTLASSSYRRTCSRPISAILDISPDWGPRAAKGWPSVGRSSSPGRANVPALRQRASAVERRRLKKISLQASPRGHHTSLQEPRQLQPSRRTVRIEVTSTGEPVNINRLEVSPLSLLVPLRRLTALALRSHDSPENRPTYDMYPAFQRVREGARMAR
jgi:hypothetical protein